MNKPTDDTGLVVVLMERFKNQRLPRAQAIKAKVDRGEVLNDFDLRFLKEVSNSINELKPFLNRNPECRQVAAHMMNLCNDIVKQGILNERGNTKTRQTG